MTVLANPDPRSEGSHPDGANNVTVTVSFDETTVFFDSRLMKAFPGIRGLRTFSGREALTRLGSLLEAPLVFPGPEGGTCTPIWWWRGGSALPIYNFRVVDGEEAVCLIGYTELRVESVTVFRSNDYQKSFVYIKSLPQTPTGAYPFSEEDLSKQLSLLGYAYEEYGVWHEHPIKRTELDDGYAEIDGQIVAVDTAEVRVRYHTPYNLLIAGQACPINDSGLDQDLEEAFTRLLNGSLQIEEFAKWYNRLPRMRFTG